MFDNNTKIIILRFLYRSNLITDRIFIELLYRYRMGSDLNLKDPVTFSEKQQWLKLYNRKKEYEIIADKFRVKEWVKDKIGSQYIIPTLGIWNNADDIEFSSLPENCILKCNHGSGPSFIVKWNKTLNKEEIKKKLNDSLKIDYSKINGEWHYKYIPRKILAEENICLGNANKIIDFKFFCFNGEPKFLKIVNYGKSKNYANYFDFNWNILPIRQSNWPPNPKFEGFKSINLENMVELCKILSCDFPFVRVDLYYVSEKIYFGELTLFQGAGFTTWLDSETDKNLGSLLTLPDYTIEK